MSNYNSLKATIDANIKQNGNQEITGQILNSVLNQMVTTLGAGYQFAGVATLDPATDPGTPDAKVFYIATGKGTYEKFGGINVTEDDVVVLYWDSSWHKVSTGIASQAKLSELDGKTSSINSDFTQEEDEIIDVQDNNGNSIVKINNDKISSSVDVIIRNSNIREEIAGLKDKFGDIESFDVDECLEISSDDESNVVRLTPYGIYNKDNTPLSYNVLYGKKWVVVGDSFSGNADEPITSNSYVKEGKYKGSLKDYSTIIGSRNGMNLVSFHRGGRTMAYPSDHTFDNAFANPSVYQSVPSDADYITIRLGINDGSHINQYSPDGEPVTGAITIGTIDSEDTGTFYGAWNVVLKYLIQQNPFAKIGIILTNGLASPTISAPYDETTVGLYNAIKEIAEKWGIPYLDMNGDQHCTAFHRAYNTKLCEDVKRLRQTAFTSGANGTHPNSKCYEFESTIIENFLRSL